MKRYISLIERRAKEWKGWYNPDSEYFRQFSTNDIHDMIAREELYMNEIDAIKNGYYRLYITKNEVNVDSWDMPSNREFNSVKYAIDKNSYKKFDGTRWNTFTKSGYYWFPHQSFLFADSIDDGIYKKR